MKNYFAAAAPFAQQVTVTEGETNTAAKAFIQPLSISSPEYMGRATPMGTVDDRRYLLIAEPGALSGKGEATVSCEGRVYELLRYELMGGGSHWEGIMRLKAGDGDVR